MSTDSHLGRRLLGIGAFIAIAAAGVFAAGECWAKPKILPPLPHGKVNSFALADKEASGPAAAADAVDGAKQRRLEEVYSRRAYHGAPPVVPHAVDNALDHAQGCNACHQKGGFVPTFAAFAPVTPHPQYSNCLQCHAQIKAAGEFSREETPGQKNDWETVSPPLLRQSSLGSAPPAIPHFVGLLRDNCAACHVGPQAPVEVRCPHPERGSCLQCHAQRVDSNGQSPSTKDKRVSPPFQRKADVFDKK